MAFNYNTVVYKILKSETDEMLNTCNHKQLKDFRCCLETVESFSSTKNGRLLKTDNFAKLQANFYEYCCK